MDCERLDALAMDLVYADEGEGLDPADGETVRVGEEVWHFVAHPDDSGRPAPLFFNRWLELKRGPRALLG